MATPPTRTAILTAAQGLIHERGFAATGMAEILAHSGTGSSSLYHHFKSKEQLLAAVLDHLHERLQAEILGPVFASTTDPVERVFAILSFYRGFLTATECRLGCPVGNLAGELSDTHPELRKRLDELFGAWRAGIVQCLRPIAARLPKHLPPEDLAIFVLAVMEGAVLQARVAKSLDPFDRAVAVLRDHFPSHPAPQGPHMIQRTVLAALLFLLPHAAQAPRAFTITREIDAPRAELFRLWTTTEGARTVFPGADARVEGRVGGDFCIRFAPHVDPAGDSFGTNGCKVREIVPDAKLVFEWRGRPDMPAMNARPFPTAVTLVFEEMGPARTKVSLTHAGFGTGPDWVPAYDYFHRAWKGVLDSLADRLAETPVIPPEFLALPKTTLYVAQLTPGPKWIAGRDALEQPRILNHVLYMRLLMENGSLLMGGRLGDDNGLGLLKVPDQAYAERLMAADPAVQAGTFTVKIRPWNTVLPEPLRAKTADAAARK